MRGIFLDTIGTVWAKLRLRGGFADQWPAILSAKVNRILVFGEALRPLLTRSEAPYAASSATSLDVWKTQLLIFFRPHSLPGITGGNQTGQT